MRHHSNSLHVPDALIVFGLILAVLGAASLTAGEASFPGVSRVDYFGYTQCIALENETTRVVLCHQAGGRVLEYSLHGKNAMWLDPAQQGWEQGNGAPSINPCGGRFDIGPATLVPRRPAFWSGAWRAEAIGPRSARLTSAKDATTGLQVVREFTLDAEGSRLRCTQTMRNVSQQTGWWGYWSRTLALGGGIAIIPLTPYSRFPNGYVMYKDGNLIDPRPSDPNIRVRDRFLEILGPPAFKKVGMDSQAGWFAYLMPNDLMFVKRFPLYPERTYGEVAGITVAIWYDGDVRCELEPIGPMEKLAPGAAASFTEEWQLEEFPFPPAGQSVNLDQVAASAGRMHSVRYESPRVLEN